MSRKCQIDVNKGIVVGNNVSHSNRKTRRRFLPNMQSYSLRSDILGAFVKFKATPGSIRTIEHNYGLDDFLLSTSDSKLASEAIKIKKRIKKVLEKREQNQVNLG
ncbi:50S ribosomal protein L28 [Candidatus Bandiella euplotis]|uniref:Large ribosomal subunit protein bL28 n=1 Tax=Candidatus Bandiella euplotis TaxID=1664265 RepID=A0ABZ0UKF1_9RICK|nr:50S ribosomal protein L28 [Candidatus Bandiella woodruffii]WPX96610.1 50S ribosomal protein L28 [Candidatus Bandiella woodruffii]